jgi:hypothetical protein
MNVDSMKVCQTALIEVSGRHIPLSVKTYQGFGIWQLLTKLWRKITCKAPLTAVDPAVMMPDICAFFLLYMGKLEVNVNDKVDGAKVIRYFPRLPEMTFLREQKKTKYLNDVKPSPAVERMKEFAKAEPSISAGATSDYRVYHKINFPVLSEIYRWQRVWNFLCVILVYF